MIDAIRPVYSSSHDGRGQNLRDKHPTFARSAEGDGDYVILSQAKKGGSDWGSVIAVGGSLGAACFILNTLVSSEGISSQKADVSKIKSISRAAAAIAALSFILFGIFKAIEKLAIKEE